MAMRNSEVYVVSLPRPFDTDHDWIVTEELYGAAVIKLFGERARRTFRLSSLARLPQSYDPLDLF